MMTAEEIDMCGRCTDEMVALNSRKLVTARKIGVATMESFSSSTHILSPGWIQRKSLSLGPDVVELISV